MPNPASPVAPIIVPLDGSDRAASALPIAAGLADRLHAPMLLVTVGADSIGAELRADLDARVAELSGREVDGVVVSTWDAAEGLTEFAAAHPGATFCMTSHGRGGLRWALLGSVAEHVVRTVDEPTVLVGPRCAPDWRPGPGPVLLAYDGTELPDPAVDAVVTWAERLETDVMVATVVHPLDVEAAEHPQTPFTEVEARIRDRGVPVSHRLVRQRYAAGALIDLAEEVGAALVVTAPHPRGALARAVLGSTAMGLVHLAPCPVVVVHHTP